MDRKSYARLRAFRDSLPILTGYGTMGIAAGMLLASNGNVSLAPLWGWLTSTCWMSGTISFAMIPEIAARRELHLAALVTLAVNFRYVFYGFPLLSRWRGVRPLRKLYLVFLLTDENFALESSCRIRDRDLYVSYCTTLSVLNHFYWMAGVTLGASAVSLLGRTLDPDTMREWTKGLEFSMAAVFIAILTDQIREAFGHGR